MSKTEKQKMLAGELYRTDTELAIEQAVTKDWIARYNAAMTLPVCAASRDPVRIKSAMSARMR